MEPFRRRIIVTGVWILSIAFVGGIVIMWLILRDVALHPQEPGFLSRSTTIPMFFMFQLFPITIPILGISGALIFAASRKQKFWYLSIVGFLALGVYWLLWVLIAGRMPLD